MFAEGRACKIGRKLSDRRFVHMEISKFLVGVLTIAIGLWVAGKLAPATLDLASKAVAAQKDHQEFRLGDWNRRLNR